MLIDDYAIASATNLGGYTFLDTHYHDGAALGDFGRLGSITQEVRIGAFFRVSF